MNEEREIITRKQAKERGLKRYFTGKPCKHGHVAERYYSGAHCLICLHERNQTDEAKQRRNSDEYRKRANELKKTQAYRDKANIRQRERWKTDKAKEARRAYLKKNEDILREKRKETYWSDPEKYRDRANKWRKNNIERARELDKLWRENNRGKCIEKRKASYYKNHEANKEKARAKVKQYQKEHPDRVKKSKRKHSLTISATRSSLKKQWGFNPQQEIVESYHANRLIKRIIREQKQKPTTNQ